jgi:hypothetical protein
MSSETPTPFESPDDLDFTPPSSKFLDGTTKPDGMTAEEFETKWQGRKDNKEMVKKFGTPEGKPNIQKIIEEYPTEVPESFTPREGRPLTRGEMNREEAKARRERLN